MLPGGDDLVLEGPTSPDEWDVVFREVRRRWPEAVSHRLGDDEYLLYRDHAAFLAGLRDVVTGNDAVIHVLMTPQSLTFVADPEPAEANGVGHELLAAVRALRENTRG